MGRKPMSPNRGIDRTESVRRQSNIRSARRRLTAGFSLIEMIVVIAIMAVLAGVAVPTVDLLQTRTRSNRTVDQMEVLKSSLDEYFVDHLGYPAQLDDLETDGYISSSFGAGDAFLDGWGNGFTYATTGTSAAVSSLGPDQVASADDIDLNVDGSPILRTRTRENMATIHLALQRYEDARIDSGLPVLPSQWFDANPLACALGLLVTHGYIENDSRYQADAWGSEFAFTGSPDVHVASVNL